MASLDLEFRARPVVSIRGRWFVLLEDVQPVLGMQLLPAADVTRVLRRLTVRSDRATSLPVWYDGSGVCCVRTSFGQQAQLGVTDLPLWLGLSVQGDVAQLVRPT